MIGAGLIGRKHAELVADAGLLDAIVDPDAGTQALAQGYGVPWFADVDAYLAQHRPGGAIIATPNQLHVPHASAFIARDIPVLIEKPIADTVAGARDLVAQAKARGVPVLVGHHRRHSALVRAAKAAIDAGRLGRLVTVAAQFWLYKPDDYYAVDWRTRAGGGPVFINLIHDIDLLRHFCGEVVSVQAAESSAIRGFEVEDTSAVILRFDSGVLGTVTISDTVVAPWSWEMTAGENPVYPKTTQAAYQIGGTHGALSVPDLALWTHDDLRSWWAPISAEPLGVSASDPLVDQLAHFREVIETGAAPRVTGHDGAQNLAVLEAIKRAALSGRVEDV